MLFFVIFLDFVFSKPFTFSVRDNVLFLSHRAFTGGQYI